MKYKNWSCWCFGFWFTCYSYWIKVMVTLNNHPLLIPNIDDPSKPLALVIFPNAITLTSRNYISWKTQVEAVLMGYDLQNHLHPAPFITNYRTWLRQDKLIFGALIGTISSKLLPLVFHRKTTHELWDMLARNRGCVTLLKPLINDTSISLRNKHTSFVQKKRVSFPLMSVYIYWHYSSQRLFLLFILHFIWLVPNIKFYISLLVFNAGDFNFNFHFVYILMAEEQY